MNIFNTIPSIRTNTVPYYGPPSQLCFWNVVEAWTVDDVVRWIQGTDDSVLPYIDGIKKYGIDGHTLAVLDDDTLCLAGINKVGVRKLILQAVRLLLHFCNSIDTENIQSLCLNICVSANELCNEIRNLFTTNMNKSEGETQRLGSLYAAISRIVDELKNLMNWLDRSPFDRLKTYIEFRMQLMSVALSFSNAVNLSNVSSSYSQYHNLIGMATQLIAKCKDVIRHSNDPLILYTAHIERIYLRRRISQLEWGFDVQSTYLGVHMISNVKLRSPADACRKLDAGDELIQVNGETVIGWDLAKVVEKIHCCSGVTKCSERALNELVLLVKKRPREPWINNISLIERPIADAAVSAECSWRYQLPSTHSTSEHVLNDSDPIDNCERDDSSSSVVSSAISYNVHKLSMRQQQRYRYRSASWNADACFLKCVPSRHHTWSNDEKSSLNMSYSTVQNSNNNIKRHSICFERQPMRSGSAGVGYKNSLSFLLSSIKSLNHPVLSSSSSAERLNIAGLEQPSSTHKSNVGACSNQPPNNIYSDMMVERRRHTMRQQPNDYVRSFIDNCLIADHSTNPQSILIDHCELDSDYINNLIHHQQLIHSSSPRCADSALLISEEQEPQEYALIEVANEDELVTLNGTMKLDEWSSTQNLSIDHSIASSTSNFISDNSTDYSTSNFVTCTDHFSRNGNYMKNSSSAVLHQYQHDVPCIITRCSSPKSSDSIIKSSHNNITFQRTKQGLSFRVRSFFSASFKSKSHSTINDTSWESDTDDEGITHYLLPARNDQLSTEDGREKGNMVQQLGTVPCEMLDAKQYEGRIRRKHLKEEICGGSVNGKWMKCWMVLRSSLLFVYDNPYAKEADLVIALANFYVSDAPELKTSKKYVFRLYRQSTVLYLSAYSLQEMKTWMNKLGLATICYDQSNEQRKCSTSFCESIVFIRGKEPCTNADHSHAHGYHHHTPSFNSNPQRPVAPINHSCLTK